MRLKPFDYRHQTLATLGAEMRSKVELTAVFAGAFKRSCVVGPRGQKRPAKLKLLMPRTVRQPTVMSNADMEGLREWELDERNDPRH